jgi:hypothetical protein
MVTPHGLSIGLGCGENKELLSLSPVQETDCASRQQTRHYCCGAQFAGHRLLPPDQLLRVCYYLQTNCCVYQELGGNYFDRPHAEGLKRHLVKRLEGLGLSVTLQPQTA